MGRDYYNNSWRKRNATHLMKWKKAESISTHTENLLLRGKKKKKGKYTPTPNYTLSLLPKAKAISLFINLMTHKPNTCKCKESSSLKKLFLSPWRSAITLSFSKISYVVRSMLNFNRLDCGCIHSWVLIYERIKRKNVLLTGMNLSTAAM